MSLCGYQIRMETRASEGTRLLYCTTGVLLRKLQHDRYLSSLTHIIVDEVTDKSSTSLNTFKQTLGAAFQSSKKYVLSSCRTELWDASIYLLPFRKGRS